MKPSQHLLVVTRTQVGSNSQASEVMAQLQYSKDIILLGYTLILEICTS